MKTQKQHGESARIKWHPAFVQALRMEFEAYRDVLEFHVEYPLVSEPLRIDCLIIKKPKDVIIEKNIATIFREYNILEYKSPRDHLKVTDFYRVYSYACLCISLGETSVSDTTISFIESRYPRELIRHLREKRGYHVAENAPGVYTVVGDILPIQIIDSRKLSADENLWLRSLSNKLDIAAFERISTEIARHDGSDVGAYGDVITQANSETMQEVMQMGTKLTLRKVLEDAGWLAEWEAQGLAKGKVQGEALGLVKGSAQRQLEIAQKMKNAGKPSSEIGEFTGLSLADIARL